MRTLLASLGLIVYLGATASAKTLIVTNTFDPGNGICDADCTLREAITDANSNPGADTISFNIPGAGPHTVTPTSALPAITESVTIDGYTQPGTAVNSLAAGDDAVLLIELNGISAGTIGLNLAADDIWIRGLVINRWMTGININGNGNVIEGNFVGTDPAGLVDLGNSFRGVSITDGDFNLVGGVFPAARNLISGTTGPGIVIFCCEDTGNRIQGNYIGTNRDGTDALPNDEGGIVISGTSFSNVVGGAAVGTGNLISGNGSNGVEITSDGSNLVQGNLIGTDVTGAAALGNAENGVLIENSPDNTIGGTFAGAGNVISGNASDGILVKGGTATGNEVQGNLIGTNLSGDGVLGNTLHGVGIDEAANNTIGGASAEARNIISGNAAGVVIGGSTASGNQIMGNYIGTDAAGSAILGNQFGVLISSNAPGNTIGGLSPLAGNLISGNDFAGIQVASGAGNVVQGNLIGTDAAGTAPLPNGNGIDLVNDSTTIGGSPEAGNTIAFSIGSGIGVSSASAGNTIFGNSIFRNGLLGIDLGQNLVTPNDFQDGDVGGNNLQNYPVLDRVTLGASRSVEGHLNSLPNTDFVLHFYRSSEVDPSGFGEGETYLGFLDGHTDAEGDVLFSFPLEADAAGQFITATATDPAGNTSEFSMASEAVPAIGRFLNISTRLKVQTGDNVLIGGFILAGTGATDVLLRAIGPSLEINGTPLAGRLANPALELFQDGVLLASNDDWKDSQQAEIEATGIPPTNDLESAIIRTLEPGAYTAIVRGVNAGTGIGLVEAYDLGANDDQRFGNISTRGLVETGDNVMIGGFILGSNAGMTIQVVVRAIGPSLTDLGLPGALQDPSLELFDSNGVMIQANDNWQDSQQAEIEATGLAPTDARESAIVSDLEPGAYTAIVRGVGETTGVGLVEAYDIH